MCRISRLCVVAGVGCVFAAVLSCEAPPRVDPIDEHHAAHMHAVHNHQIASLMKAIARTHKTIRRRRMGTLNQRRRYLGYIKESATELTESAEELRGFAKLEDLPAREKSVLMAYVDTLRDHAIALRDAADARNERRVSRAFAQLTSTCNGCHHAFREQIREHRRHLHGEQGDEPAGE